MKRYRVHSLRPATRAVGRRGSIFNYYMMYLMLTGLMISSAGIMLHVVLRSGVIDDADQQQLRTMVRLERRLRSDRSTAGSLTVSNGELRLHSAGDQHTQWTCDGNTVTRTVQQGDDVTGRDRFVFSRSTAVHLLEAESGTIVMRILLQDKRYKQSSETIEKADDDSQVFDQVTFRPGVRQVDILIGRTSAVEGEQA
jgi:hypothetical protein